MKENKKITKRGFLKRMTALGGVCTVLFINRHRLMSEPLTVNEDNQSTLEMPMIQFGKYKISKLIVGGNQMAWKIKLGESSYNYYDEWNKDYLPFEDALNILRICERNGINAWQSRGDSHIMHMLFDYRNRGGKLYWIGQTASEVADVPRNIKTIASHGAIATYHHGSKTDELWRNGEIDKVNEMLKVIRDTGVMVGLGSHIPEALEYAEEKDWNIDFYMAALLGDENREKMCKFIRQTEKICLAFKILDASRRCKTPESTRKSFEYALKNIKKNDAIVVGMFLPYHVIDNIRYVKTIFR